MTDFPFEYVAGGWFRARGVPKGEPAAMLHGDHAIELLERMIGAFCLIIHIGMQVHDLEGKDP